jgi:hypothetical protein
MVKMERACSGGTDQNFSAVKVHYFCVILEDCSNLCSCSNICCFQMVL